MANGVMVIGGGGGGGLCAGLAGGAGVFRGAKRRRGSNPKTEFHLTRVESYMLTIHPTRGAPSDALVSAAPLPRGDTRLRRAFPREDHVHVFPVRPTARPHTCGAPDHARAEPLPLINVGGPVGTGHESVHSPSSRRVGVGVGGSGAVVVVEPWNQVVGGGIGGAVEWFPVGRRRRRQTSGLVHYRFQSSASAGLFPCSSVLGNRGGAGGGLYGDAWWT